jgi:hypothetical protein
MKRLMDYTDDEILALTEDTESLNRLFDIECAHQGIPLLPQEAGPKPEVETFEHDAMVFEIGSIGFDCIEDANEVLNLIASKQLVTKSYQSGGGYAMEKVDPGAYNYPKVERQPCFSKKMYEETKERQKIASERKNEWMQRDQEYRKVQESRQEVYDSFWDRVSTIRQKRDNISRIVANFNRYLDLADGNRKVAANFLLDACKDGSIVLENETIWYVDDDGQKHLTEIYTTTEPVFQGIIEKQ